LIEVLFICSIFCSSDIIAAVTIIKFEEQPTLFSVILGEGLFNDAVAVILYQTMKNVVLEIKEDGNGKDDIEDFQTVGFFFETVWFFLKLCFNSILVGTLSGVIPTWLLKKCRFISHSAIGESTLLLIFAMIGYFLSEVFHLSGIVSILCTSLVYSHYAFFNLSPQGKNITSILF
jgi:solute carrier family 9 (sodium/hydrogen exchanger), member 6/7